MKISILLTTCNKSPFEKLIRLLKARLHDKEMGPGPWKKRNASRSLIKSKV